jgi:hypothetical protein
MKNPCGEKSARFFYAFFHEKQVRLGAYAKIRLSKKGKNAGMR